MISLKKYLDSQQADSAATMEPAEVDLLPAVVDAYGSALMEMGNCSLDACPGMGDELKRNLGELKTGLSASMSTAALATTDAGVREQIARMGPRNGEALPAEGMRSERNAADDGADGGIGGRARPAMRRPDERGDGAAEGHRQPRRPDRDSHVDREERQRAEVIDRPDDGRRQSGARSTEGTGGDLSNQAGGG